MNSLSPRAQQIMPLARREADRLGNPYIDAEHLLLGILRLKQGVAFRCLERMGIAPGTLKTELEAALTNRAKHPTGSDSSRYTKRFKSILLLADRESRAAKCCYRGTEHLLLGILREGRSQAYLILEKLGVDLERTRLVVEEELAPPSFTEPEQKHTVYLDVETKQTAAAVGGWEHLDKMGISVAVAFVSGINQLRIFTEENLADLQMLLQQADRVIGYNIVNFDAKVLSGYPCIDLSKVKFMDLMTEIAAVIGHRVSLDSLRGATLGQILEPDGLDLIRFWQEGHREKVIETCCNDVLAMAELHQSAIQNGKLYYFGRDGVTRHRIKTPWRN